MPEFSEFFAKMSNYDSVLICGDFNIHICCLSSQMASEFQSILPFFDLFESVIGLKHKQAIHWSLLFLMDFPFPSQKYVTLVFQTISP